MTATLPPRTPLPVVRTATRFARQGYTVDRLYRFPGYDEPLLRMFITGPRWVLFLLGVAWLAAWLLYRFPLTREAGAALLLSRATAAPVVYIDAHGIAH